MMWRAWVAGWVGVVGFFLLPVAMFMVEIWGDQTHYRYGDTGGITLLFLFLPLLGLMSTWTWMDDGDHRPERGPRLHRAGRKALKAERQRIELDAAIARLEAEVRS